MGTPPTATSRRSPPTLPLYLKGSRPFVYDLSVESQSCGKNSRDYCIPLCHSFSQLLLHNWVYLPCIFLFLRAIHWLETRHRSNLVCKNWLKAWSSLTAASLFHPSVSLWHVDWMLLQTLIKAAANIPVCRWPLSTASHFPSQQDFGRAVRALGFSLHMLSDLWSLVLQSVVTSSRISCSSLAMAKGNWTCKLWVAHKCHHQLAVLLSWTSLCKTYCMQLLQPILRLRSDYCKSLRSVGLSFRNNHFIHFLSRTSYSLV